MSSFDRLDDYIGRASQKEALIGWSKRIAEEGGCRVLAFEAGGGLGKTGLLHRYPALVAPYCPHLRIGPIIDLYDFENRSAAAIEEQIIRGLRQTSAEEWYRLPAHIVDMAFEPYSAASAEITRMRQLGYEETQRPVVDQHISFVHCWNRLAQLHPLVMRFDTLETLIGPQLPATALVCAAQTSTERDMVSGWMRLVFPHLERTLVILSGRPAEFGGNGVLADLAELGLLAGEVQLIAPLHASDEIDDYLSGYGQQLDPDELAAVLRITEGRPLLLTCWAATQSLLPQRNMHLIADRAAFEDWLVDAVLDPLAYDDDEPRTLGFCLYVLSYARRGIRPSELGDLLAALGLPFKEAVLATLQNIVLVKVVTDESAGGATPLLFLHDEIYQLIDESAKPDDLGLREPTLDYLCALSERQVRTAQGRTATLKAMANHMYYAMCRDLAERGYVLYAIYIQRLLRERNVEHALILSDVFWSTLTMRVRRGDRLVQPYLALFSVSPRRYEQLLLEERLRHIKLLRAQEKVALALNAADQLYHELSDAGQLPSDRLLVLSDLASTDSGAEPVLAFNLAGQEAQPPPGSAHFYADLAVTWAGLALQVRPSAAQDQISMRCSQVIAFLEGLDDEIADSLLRHRRWALLGTAYVTRGTVHEQRVHFAEAQADVAAGLRAFLKHKAAETDDSADEVAIDVAQTRLSLARLCALDGEIERAGVYVEEVLAVHAAAASPYHRALYYHYYGTLLLMRGDSNAALDALRLAEAAALEAGSKRARGLVYYGYALVERHQLVTQQHLSWRPSRNFAEAASLLQGEQSARLEVRRVTGRSSMSNWHACTRQTAITRQLRCTGGSPPNS